MGNVITIGVDLAKSVFQVHGVDAEGMTVVRRQLRRRQVLPFFEKLPPCLVGMEACATSHHWARELEQLGHRVRLMPPRYVKAYVKNQKNDAADAEAICEAVTRPTMRFVEIKTTEQQSVLILHRTRQMFVRQRTTLINAIRAHLAEFGIVAQIGRNGVEALLQTIAERNDARVPAVARSCLEALVAQLYLVKRQISRSRSPDPCLAPVQRDQPAARLPSRRRPAGRNSVGCQCAQPAGLQVRPRPGRLDRPCSKAELERRQRPAWQHFKAWQPLSAHVADRRRPCRDPLCRDARHRPPALACKLA